MGFRSISTELTKLRSSVSGDTFVNPNDVNSVDEFISLTQPFGSKQYALGNNLYGINHRNIKGILPENRDDYGLVFFTRPLLNLSAGNLRNGPRKMRDLLTTQSDSMQRYVRCMLDPRTHLTKALSTADIQKLLPNADRTVTTTLEGQTPVTSTDNGTDSPYEWYNDDATITPEMIQAAIDSVQDETLTVSSPFVDEELGFIPLLTNNLQSMSGWPDIVMPTFTSKEGLKREQWSIADGYVDINEAYDIDCTFKNIKDEPLVLLFDTWLNYMDNVYSGMFSPYIDFIVENEIDYNTRIYRIVLDESKRFVKKIAATGACFPVNVPTGKMFDYSDSAKYNTDNNTINVRFKCMGANYNDPILVHEFNTVTAIFNPEIRKLITGNKAPNIVEIPPNLLEVFNYRGYPLIDKNTLELRWFINKNSATYKNVVKKLRIRHKNTTSTSASGSAGASDIKLSDYL